jgi:hypothetical protein
MVNLPSSTLDSLEFFSGHGALSGAMVEQGSRKVPSASFETGKCSRVFCVREIYVSTFGGGLKQRFELSSGSELLPTRPRNVGASNVH